MDIKKILLISFLVVVVGLIGIMIYFNFFYRKNNDVSIKSGEDIINKMTSDDKKVLKIEESESDRQQEKIKKEIEEKTTTDEFKKYDELTDDEKKEIDFIPRKDIIPTDEIDDIINDEKNDNIEIPSSYDLRDYIGIKVENQEDYGLCWAFASLNALETHIALTKKKVNDFSEIHLDYVTSRLLYGSRPVHGGGNWSNFSYYFRVSGPVLEDSETSYKDQSKDVYSKYSDMNSDVVVTKDVSFPAIYKTGVNKTSEEDTKKIRDAIKRHIMTNGGVFAGIDTKGTVNQYSYDSWFPNHAITIIGWDDNYSRENFAMVTERNVADKDIPEHDGAYIALNSWGKEWGNGGYFYISYDDQFVETDVNGIVSMSMEYAHKVKDIKSDKIRQYIIDHFKINFISYKGEDYITDFFLDGVSSLDLSNMGITNDDLEDIGMFSKLNYLNLSGNQLTSISKLPELKRLNQLLLSDNQLTSVNELSKYSELWNIDVSNNNISNLPKLSGNFSYLKFSNNHISDVSNLSGITSCSYLDLSNNNVRDVSSLKGSEFYSVILSNNKGIRGYSALSTHYLAVDYCDIDNLEDLSSNERVAQLNFSNNNIKQINQNELPNSISSLMLSGNHLSSLEFLNKSNNLYYLDISNNDISTLNGLAPNDFGFEINISNNPIKDIKTLNEYPSVSVVYSNSKDIDFGIFNDVKNIVRLDLSNDNISDLSSLNLEKLNLFSLDISGNKGIKGFDYLSKLKNLQSLVANECDINNLDDIVKLNNLQSLSLISNDIGDVSVFNNMDKLETLNLANNSKLSGNLKRALLNLDISNTNVTSLDFIKNISDLYYLNVIGNNMMDLDKVENYVKSNQYMYITYSKFKFDVEKIHYFSQVSNVFLEGEDGINIEIHLNNQKFEDYIKSHDDLKWCFMQIVAKDNTMFSNGIVDKKIKSISFDDANKPFSVSIVGRKLEFYQE